MAAQSSVHAKLDSAFLVQPDAIFALTVLLESIPPYDAEQLTELLAAGGAGAVPHVNLLGIKADPDRFLLEIERGPSRAYVIVRAEPYARSLESELGPTLAHAGIWPGSTIPPRTLAKLQGDRYVSPRAPDGEVQLISHIARRLIEKHGLGLVVNRADQAIKPRDRALYELGRVERPEHLPFAAWIEPKIVEEDGARWWAAVGLEPLALPDVYVRIPRPELEPVTRNALAYACWYLTKDHPEGLVYLPDSFHLDEGSIPRLGESNSFIPHRRRPHVDPWRLYLEPNYSST
jgi:hypothetical protein